MTKTESTPAPWKLDGDIVRTDSGTAICGMLDETGEDWTDVEMNANARLIAAAPDMLRALEIMVAIFNAVSTNTTVALIAIEIARAAIVKARGE